MDRLFERAELVRILGEPLAKPPNDIPIRIRTSGDIDATSNSSLLRWDCFASEIVFAQMLDAIMSDHDFAGSGDDVMHAVSALERTFSCLAQNVVGDLCRFIHCCPRHRATIAALIDKKN